MEILYYKFDYNFLIFKIFKKYILKIYYYENGNFFYTINLDYFEFLIKLISKLQILFSINTASWFLLLWT